MALLTVTMALTFSDFVAESMPDSEDTGSWDLTARLDPGPNRWGDGDERVVLHHRGGPALYLDHTRILITLADDQTTVQGSDLGGAFDDGALTIGERWTRNLTIPPDSTVDVRVVQTQPPATVIAHIPLETGSRDCSLDTKPPTVDAFSQVPSDLDGGHVGEVTVTATLGDDCSGVNRTVTPHLMYRLPEGSNLTDAGAMEHVSTNSWQLGIPEPSDGWEAHENETLTYHLDPIEDLAGNRDTSREVDDTIEPGKPDPGTLTYPSDAWVFSGSLDDFDAMTNASDDGRVANLTEAETGSGPVSSEVYGTAHSSSDAQAPGNATGSPDDGHAVLPSDKAWVGVSGYDTFQGTVRSVEIAFEGHANGTANGAEDELELAYEVSGVEGATKDSYNVSDLGQESDGPARFVNVTADRDWTWSDVSNLLVKATYAKLEAEDDVNLSVDALWTRVEYEDPGYNLSVQTNVTDVPSGTLHEVELRYRTTGEVFHVDVWNATDGAWQQRGPNLTHTSLANATFELEDAEVDAGDVDLRFRDDGPDALEQDTLAVDYVRVRTR